MPHSKFKTTTLVFMALKLEQAHYLPLALKKYHKLWGDYFVNLTVFFIIKKKCFVTKNNGTNKKTIHK